LADCAQPKSPPSEFFQHKIFLTFGSWRSLKEVVESSVIKSADPSSGRFWAGKRNQSALLGAPEFN